ncbi:MAG: pyridoxine 5'-phosphate synthase [Elusimicrobiales bacterium]|nr:pyridoxine 5'-phosphate synthase [Elusimicrobiales bacterium]
MKRKKQGSPGGMRLGVNIDHVATIRQARLDVYPDLLEAAAECFKAGADGITVHLREDRRHIQDADVKALRRAFPGRHLNLEMAAVDVIADIAVKIKPDEVCLVPENRREVTTEGGLDAAGNAARVKAVVKKLQKAGISVSLFINDSPAQVRAAAGTGAEMIELHTGTYAELSDPKRSGYDRAGAKRELKKLFAAAELGRGLGLQVNAGHGLTYDNTAPFARRTDLFAELNIGHNIIARAVFVGLRRAVAEMKRVIVRRRPA